MKNDSTITFLNFVLAALLLLSVGFAILTIWQSHQMTIVGIQAQQVNLSMQRLNGLINDSTAYNATAHNPDLAHVLQLAAQPTKPAGR